MQNKTSFYQEFFKRERTTRSGRKVSVTEFIITCELECSEYWAKNRFDILDRAIYGPHAKCFTRNKTEPEIEPKTKTEPETEPETKTEPKTEPETEPKLSQKLID